MASRLNPRKKTIDDRRLRDQIVGFSGSFKNKPRDKLKRMVSNRGGKVTSGTNPKPTVVVCTLESYKQKKKTVMLQYAKDYNLPIVNIDWLEVGGDTKEYELRSMVSKGGREGRKDEGTKRLARTVKELTIGNNPANSSPQFMKSNLHSSLFADCIQHAMISLKMVETYGVAEFNDRVDRGLMDEWKIRMRTIKLEELDLNR
jgi:hypothetical protein